MTHKFVDDTTMTEILHRSDTSCMQSFVDELVQQATDVGMLVNSRKTKEMFISSILRDPPSPVSLSGEVVERVATFKLLGVHVSNDLKWAQHIHAISRKGASRLYFLKQLKRAGAGTDDLLHFYSAVISSPGVRLSSMTLQPNYHIVKDTGIASEKSNEYYLSFRTRITNYH